MRRDPPLESWTSPAGIRLVEAYRLEDVEAKLAAMRKHVERAIENLQQPLFPSSQRDRVFQVARDLLAALAAGKETPPPVSSSSLGEPWTATCDEVIGADLRRRGGDEAMTCPHAVVLLGNRKLSSGRGVCVDCLRMVAVDLRSPDCIPTFALVRMRSWKRRKPALAAGKEADRCTGCGGPLPCEGCGEE